MKIMLIMLDLLVWGSFDRFFPDLGKIWFIIANHKFLVLPKFKFDLTITTISQYKGKSCLYRN